jgi:hypothetical protein
MARFRTTVAIVIPNSTAGPYQKVPATLREAQLQLHPRHHAGIVCRDASTTIWAARLKKNGSKPCHESVIKVGHMVHSDLGLRAECMVQTALNSGQSS